MDEGTGILPGLPAIAGKPVYIAFDGGRMTSDAGILLLAAIEQRLGIAEEFAKLSPGLALLAEIVHDATCHNIYEVDLSAGTSDYKALFSDETYRLYRGVWHRASARGLACRGYLSAVWRYRKMRERRS